MTAPELVRYPSRLASAADLVCFPGAGAGAEAFRGWAAGVPGYVALTACRLPGRERLIDRAPMTDLAGAARAVADMLLAEDGPARPRVLFGHSMGGAIAFETARHLEAAGRAPLAVVLAASAPPRGVAPARPVDDAELAALLCAYDPANRAITETRELFAALSPVIAADLAMLRGHRMEGPPLGAGTRMVLLGGAGDTIVPADAIARWKAFASGPAEQAALPGGHFFPFREAVKACIGHACAPLRHALRAAR